MQMLLNKFPNQRNIYQVKGLGINTLTKSYIPTHSVNHAVLHLHMLLSSLIYGWIINKTCSCNFM